MSFYLSIYLSIRLSGLQMGIYWILYMSRGSLLGTFLLFGTPYWV